jgi:hypothetical protein
MSVAIGIAVAALVIAMWLEIKNRSPSGKRDNPYNLIDLQAEIRRRNEVRRKEEDENR